MMTETKEELIEKYFRYGYPYKDIIELLNTQHNISVSIRSLQRCLKRLGLSRKNDRPSSNIVMSVIDGFLKSHGNSRGYRNVKQRLAESGVQFSYELVRVALKEIDSEGVKRREKRRLKRRKYTNAGPNDVWHIDGNDKIKPFGFGIHGGIDGFSRKILWLRVADTNKNPGIVSSYYIKAIQVLQAAPRRVRGDRGTENGTVYGIQRFLRRNHTDSFNGQKSFQYGKSVSNQRIEAWWSLLKKDTLQQWIDCFKDMRDSGLYDDSNNVHVEALKLCYYSIVQNDLDNIVNYWNHHKIRPTKGSEAPHGRPDIMYHLPWRFGAIDKKVDIDSIDMNIAASMHANRPKQFCCSEEFAEFAAIVMSEHNLHWPKNRQEAEELYAELVYIAETTV